MAPAVGSRSSLGTLLLSVVLGVSCAVFTFLTLDSLGNDSGFSNRVLSYRPSDLLSSAGFNIVGVRDTSSSNVTEGGKGEGPTPPKDVRVLVWVMTQPENHQKKAVHVRDTWGSRVDKLLFMSTADDPDLPAVNLHHKEGRNELWGKTKAAFKHVYDNNLQDADWFMKADDDTFVVVENLRYMLSLYDPEVPIYFGSRFKKFSPQGYMSGGGGYVLSKAALKLFVEQALTQPTLCKTADSGAEDAEMGKCLDKIGVLAGDSRDESGRGRFFPFVPAHHLVSGFIGEKSWYWDYIYYPMKVGPECCSDSAITFHYISPDKMRELEYLLYHLRPYGSQQAPLQYPPALPPDLSSVPDKVIQKYGNKSNPQVKKIMEST